MGSHQLVDRQTVGFHPFVGLKTVGYGLLEGRQTVGFDPVVHAVVGRQINKIRLLTQHK